MCLLSTCYVAGTGNNISENQEDKNCWPLSRGRGKALKGKTKKVSHIICHRVEIAGRCRCQERRVPSAETVAAPQWSMVKAGTAVWRPTATHLQSRDGPREGVNSGFILKVKATWCFGVECDRKRLAASATGWNEMKWNGENYRRYNFGRQFS